MAPIKGILSLLRTALASSCNTDRWGLGLRSFSTQAATTESTPQPPPPPQPPQKTHFGNLKDEDRIFTKMDCMTHF